MRWRWRRRRAAARALFVGLGGGTQVHMLTRLARPKLVTLIERDPDDDHDRV